MGAPILGTTLRAACRVAIASLAVFALWGCTFGDESLSEAKPDGGSLFSDNCVPVECLFQCCQGWAYHNKPSLRGGNVTGYECNEVTKRDSAYSEYVALMLEPWNYCSSEFQYFESGYCYEVQAPDVIKKFTESGQPVYSGLNFSVCPPRGQKAARPMDDIEFIPKE